LLGDGRAEIDGDISVGVLFNEAVNREDNRS